MFSVFFTLSLIFFFRERVVIKAAVNNVVIRTEPKPRKERDSCGVGVPLLHVSPKRVTVNR